MSEDMGRAIGAMVPLIADRLRQAAAIAAGADACLKGGDRANAIKIINEVDQVLYEATTLVNAASLMNRLDEE